MTLDPSQRDGLPPIDVKFLQCIEKVGWHVMTVAPRLGGEAGDTWAYSSGLYYSYGHPEIIIFNLERASLQEIINSIGESVKKGKKFESGPSYADILEGYDCSFRDVDPTHYREYVGFSLWFYEGPNFPMLECFWPDLSNRFPWDPLCEDWARKAQPFLNR